VEKGKRDYSRRGEIVPISPEISDDFKAKTLEMVREGEERSLDDADIVVSDLGVVGDLEKPFPV
jgi:hypothetical protein